ncbi:zinc finger protein 551-like [Pipistrellus kuhlii]|uniref:zinc finger protein 551-like n=1 Tax=Pipistrellus kuhlii TaxID=59472 RepID=UPI001E271FC6|nr:zinc finger protein 551-like [Pipistrellus kuhlii]
MLYFQHTGGAPPPGGTGSPGPRLLPRTQRPQQPRRPSRLGAAPLRPQPRPPPGAEMNFEDVAIAFSQEEWGLLDEAQRLLYCDVMLEVFALVSSVGCWHKMDDEEEVCLEQSISVQVESQSRASKTAPATQRNHLCRRCFSVYKDILHLTVSQAADFEQTAFFSDACVRDFCFSGNPQQQQRDASGEKPWKKDVDRASFVTRCSFYLPWVPSTNKEIGEDFPAIPELLQPQAPLSTEETHSGSDVSQEYLGGKSLQQTCNCEKFGSHNQKVVQCQGACSGEGKYECEKCGRVFKRIFHLIQHGTIHTNKKPYQCTDCGKSFRNNKYLFNHKRVHRGKKTFKCIDCGEFFGPKLSLIQHHNVHTREKPYECSDCGKSFRVSSRLKEYNRVHTGESPYDCTDCGKSFSRNHALFEHKRIHTVFVAEVTYSTTCLT